jgi:hypothetical protein
MSSMLEEVDVKDELDMEDDKGKAAATLFEVRQFDQLTTDSKISESSDCLFINI